MPLWIIILLIAIFGFGFGGVLLFWAAGAFDNPHAADKYCEWFNEEHIDD